MLCYSFTILRGAMSGYSYPVGTLPANESLALSRKAFLANNMRFSQLDRIIELDKGASIKAVKCLSLSEEYLNDHFPRFPVMPGVLMLESMFQASMWLVRESTEFRYSTVVLRETKSLKFQRFLQPGNSLVVNAEIKSMSEDITKLKVAGSIEGEPAVSGRLVIESYNLAEREGRDEAVDQYMIEKFRQFYRRLWSPVPVAR